MIFVQEAPYLCKVTTRGPQLKLVSESSLFWVGQAADVDGWALASKGDAVARRGRYGLWQKQRMMPTQCQCFGGIPYVESPLHIEIRQVCLSFLVLYHSLHIET